MISTDEMLLRLGDDHADTDTDLLEKLIEGAHTYVETQTRRSFRGIETFSEVLEGRGTTRLFLHSPFASGVYETLMVWEFSEPGATPTEIVEGASDGFEVRESKYGTHLIRLGGYVWTDGYEYEITYTRGYVAGEEPADIRDLIAALVAHKLQIRGAGGGAMRSETIGGYSYTRFGSDDLEAVPFAKETIEAWRRPILV